MRTAGSRPARGILRVAMQVLRHARFTLATEIYTLASSKATRAALKRLGDSLDGTSSTNDEDA